LGKGATEAAFESQPLGDFEIIHVATHGIANQRFPDRAALVFVADPQSKDDGLLQIPEIMHLDLRAELVVQFSPFGPRLFDHSKLLAAAHPTCPLRS
jgi:CHAT domain-containing protein